LQANSKAQRGCPCTSDGVPEHRSGRTKLSDVASVILTSNNKAVKIIKTNYPLPQSLEKAKYFSSKMLFRHSEFYPESSSDCKYKRKATG
jgi:hypothetical protein